MAGQTLNVYAAASLTGAFQELAQVFSQTHPGVKVQFNFAGSQILLTQIQQGAPADVLASADLATMDKAQKGGWVQQPQIFAQNELVLIVPQNNPAGIHTLADLPRAQKVVLGVPDVPVGAYARQVLNKANAIYGKDFSRTVLAHVVSQETDVKQVVSKVELGEADAAFVYRTDVEGQAAEMVHEISLPAAVNVTATYPLAVVVHAPHPDLAAQFVSFVCSPKGQEVLQSFGFNPGMQGGETHAQGAG
ncbi:MAG: molybdate ABC transporter substrate-binding protein [Alicyclobacillus sp.]|nr:molybdate ABC transporter substrate-binding protein [Alicyclobacillus sp.]